MEFAETHGSSIRGIRRAAPFLQASGILCGARKKGAARWTCQQSTIALRTASRASN
jgi:hypothetical protein